MVRSSFFVVSPTNLFVTLPTDDIYCRINFIRVSICVQNIATYPEGKCQVCVGEKEDHQIYNLYEDLSLMDIFKRIPVLTKEYQNNVDIFEHYSDNDSDCGDVGTIDGFLSMCVNSKLTADINEVQANFPTRIRPVRRPLC